MPFHMIILAPRALSPSRSGLKAWYIAPIRFSDASHWFGSQVRVSNSALRVTNERMKPSEKAPCSESPFMNDGEVQIYSPQPLAVFSAPTLKPGCDQTPSRVAIGEVTAVTVAICASD